MEPGLKIAAALALALTVSACAAGASNCAGWQPIRPSSQDKMTSGTQRQVLAHNRQGVAQGCWRAPR